MHAWYSGSQVQRAYTAGAENGEKTWKEGS